MYSCIPWNKRNIAYYTPINKDCQITYPMFLCLLHFYPINVPLPSTFSRGIKDTFLFSSGMVFEVS